MLCYGILQFKIMSEILCYELVDLSVAIYALLTVTVLWMQLWFEIVCDDGLG